MEVSRDANGIAHIVALSGGKDSTAMALRLAEVEPRPYTYICTPTGDELPAMFDHWRRLSDLLGSRIWPITYKSGLVGLCHEQKAIPNFRMRFCTRILKLEPFYAFMAKLQNAVAYVGLRADEMDREGMNHGGDASLAMSGIKQRYPMQDWGWGLADVMQYLDGQPVEIPDRTDCGLCFFQRLGEWYLLWRDHPAHYAAGEKLETELGHTFRSSQRDTWPASLHDLRLEFERGRKPEISLRMMEKRKHMCRACTL